MSANTQGTSQGQGISTSSFLTDWHKALLWFLGAVALIAIAGPAPKIAIMLVLIILSLILLKYWPSVYAPFLGLK
jgi:hypothetical protein